jgi:transposase
VSTNSKSERSEKVKAEILALMNKQFAAPKQEVVGPVGRKPTALAYLARPQRYLAEKRAGIRRENGALKLTRLTHRHYKIIGLHLEGKSIEEISNTLHLSYSTISRVLNDPLAQQILKRVYNHREEEIHALAGKAIEATREALTGDYPVAVKLRGVDRFVKIREVMVNKEQGRESAEDVIARILSNAKFINSNVQINVGDTSASVE